MSISSVPFRPSDAHVWAERGVCSIRSPLAYKVLFSPNICKSESWTPDVLSSHCISYWQGLCERTKQVEQRNAKPSESLKRPDIDHNSFYSNWTQKTVNGKYARGSTRKFWSLFLPVSLSSSSSSIPRPPALP